jgi:hypothetical protein
MMMNKLAMALAICAALPCAAAPRDTRPADGACEWRNPGSDRYMLPLDAAVDRLDTIPAESREKLQSRLRDPRKHVNADDHILVTAAGAQGVAGTYSLWDMNGGNGGVCWGEVTTRTWRPEHAERALVFCEDGHCIAYYSVCRNISRAVPIARRLAATAPMIDADLSDPDVALSFDSQPRRFALTAIPGDSDGTVLDTSGPVGATWESLWWGTLPQRYSGGSPFAMDLFVPEVPTGEWSPVAPVPEPSAYAMMLLGLGLVAWMARRRRKASQPSQPGVRVTAHCVSGSQP